MPISTELFATMTRRLEAHTAPDDVAAEAARLWLTLFDRFSVLIGPLSVELVFARSLVLHRDDCGWLPHVTPDAAAGAFDAFARTLDSRPVEELIAVNRALLWTYVTILSELIGTPLATKFLHAAFDRDASDHHPQEYAP